MTSHPLPFAPATNPTAQKLLPSKRCRQIEVWLEETVQYESLQRCATDKRHGHGSEAPLFITSERPFLEPTTSSSMPSTPAVVPVCPVCHKPFSDVAALSHAATPPTSSDASIVPSNPNTKPKLVLRGLRTVTRHFSFKGRDNSHDPKETAYDPALSTKMFLVPPTGKEEEDSNSNNKKKKNHHRNSSNRGDNHSLHSSSSSFAASFLRLGDSDSNSDDDNKGGVNRILNERMARLKRAQKLLEKSQGRG